MAHYPSHSLSTASQWLFQVQGLITLTLCDRLACVNAELTISKCQEMTHTPQRSPFSAEHQAIALSISIFSNTIQVLIWPLLVYVPHVREISKEKAPLVWHNEPCRYFKKKAFPKHKIIMTESWEKNGAVFEGKHAMWKTKHMTPRWEGLPCVCVREGFKRLEDESTSVVGHTHTPLSLAAIWASLGRPQGDYGRATSPKSSWVPAQGGEMVLKS